ncbi:MAG: 50S ribosomal protein L25/general stress protein Ctc [Gallionellales bacterium RIFCSPLOWO2_12_FULL_59_22]|nr:MAG: 50S ribosomal protein L25/general stress protein Ctc [Gallionellales bacterium RIFCSPLOWO2_02_FULL_59_110]OGT04470.1 MAG: 50S ribosomal protein L25/general stress protein Ctc [Gallionellales bacterium RIFCSPLOWO2_02_58_13]OGT11593.1 MAG: 50S ribosomal protein L25/general stress protein Ctc [Gallionellales bacterium RIFCSPLOWO2_12_FULL_59_22]
MAIEIIATTRKAQGTGASRRLRKAGRVPGIVYGVGDVNMIEMEHNDLYYKLRNEAFHASILTLNLDGKNESVMLRDFVMHPFRQQVQHIDFQRVDATKKMHIKVPLHFLNESSAPGVKVGGGKISHVMNELDITCLPKDLPAFIEVDLGKLELGHSVHVSDLKLPEGVEAAAHGTHTAEAVVATVQVPRGAVEVEVEATAEVAPAAAPSPAKETKK